jgi:hypothetical protein
MISLIVGLVAAALIFYLVVWAVDYIGVPEPFNKVIKVIIVVIVVIYLINILLGFTGNGLLK